MNIVIDDLGELSTSGAQAIQDRDTVYVHEGLPESERATVLALLDARRVADAPDRTLREIGRAHV